MAQLEFSVPYNGDAATLRQLIALQRRNGNVIREIYLNAPQAITGVRKNSHMPWATFGPTP